MTLLYNKWIGNTILDCAIRGAIGGAHNNTTSSNLTWYIMSGAQPTPADTITNWATYYNNNILFKGWSGASTHISLSVNSRLTPGTASITASGSRTAASSGTASWAIITSRVDASEPLQSSLTSDPSFMIVPVSATGGTGILQLNTINLTASSSFSFNFTLYMGGGSN